MSKRKHLFRHFPCRSAGSCPQYILTQSSPYLLSPEYLPPLEARSNAKSSILPRFLWKNRLLLFSLLLLHKNEITSPERPDIHCLPVLFPVNAESCICRQSRFPVPDQFLPSGYLLVINVSRKSCVTASSISSNDSEQYFLHRWNQLANAMI